MPNCTLKQLPDHLLAEAARIAVEINPQNAPPARGINSLAAFMPMDAGAIALLTSKKWPTPLDLSVQFLDSPDAATRDMIMALANRWNAKGAAMRFRWTQGQGDIRIARDPNDGYWSYLGTDCRTIPVGQPTMNLANFTRNTLRPEQLRVGPHEFGHAAGFPHEHQRAEVIARLKREVVIQDMMRETGWSREQVIQQVFNPLRVTEIMATATADELSAMCYEFRAEWTVDGRPILGGSDITELDYRFVATVYPGTVAPPPPPPPGNTVSFRVREVHFTDPVRTFFRSHGVGAFTTVVTLPVTLPGFQANQDVPLPELVEEGE